MSENAIYNAIKEYCENETSNGLGLLAIPTGAGKSTAAMNYVRDCLLDEDNHQVFYFVTPRKTNLPTLEQFCNVEDPEQKELLKSKFVFLRRNADYVVENFNNVQDLIPEVFKNTKEYEDLYSAYYDAISHDYSNEQISDIISTQERAFREKIKQIIHYYRINKLAINTSWIPRLYTDIDISKKQFVVMTLHKFLLGHDTIFNGNLSFYKSNKIERGIVFFDEFDSTKEDVLNVICDKKIEQKNNERINCFDFIYSFKEYMEKFYNEEYLCNEFGIIESDFNTIDKIRFLNKKYDEIINRCLEINHVTMNEPFEVYLDYNNQYFASREINKSEKDFMLTCIEVRHFIHYLAKLIGWLCNNNYNYVYNFLNSLKISEEQTSQETGEKETIYKEFKYAHKLYSKVVEMTNGAQHSDFNYMESSSFQSDGFSYLEFQIERVLKKDKDNNDVSKTMATGYFFDFRGTPEKILLKTCRKHKVIGMSATAKIDSVISNYQLDYIKKELGDNYFKLSDESYDNLVSYYKSTQEGYEDVIIEPTLIGLNDKQWENEKENVFAEFISNPTIRINLYDYINKNAIASYYCETYYRLAHVFRKFIDAKELNSLLCLMNSLPAPNKQIDSVYLEQVLRYVYEDSGMSRPFEDAILVKDISGSGKPFDLRKEEIQELLGDGRKVFVITSYGTMSTGQNFTYQTPEDEKDQVIHVNKTRKISNTKDFDAIYLDDPTNIITNFKGELDLSGKIHSFFETENLFAVSDISKEERDNRIIATVENLKTNPDLKVYGCPSVKKARTKIILQALGRIDRTEVKGKHIYIYLHKKLKGRISKDIPDKGSLSTISKKTLKSI